VTATAGLPHRYPFRFVDTVIQARDPEFSRGTVATRVSADGRALADSAWGSPMLLAEAIAQAALALENADPEVQRRGFLAGIDDFEVLRVPEAGESLEIDVKLAARFGAIVRFEGVVRSAGERIAAGSVIVRQGEPESVR
jgi:3-hydroxymyristoyl/3-hydroxydecanoyl-(acyl carrier protein) dehydratase